ncbi:hypothetical protein C823_007941 [Eubacterium plexicaudatum ASF492]|nr:hypothetical protein C823_007941 [Eubacterium plexicaudatum ASF492]
MNKKCMKNLKRYGRSEIPEREGLHSLRDFDVTETLAAIWDEYGKKTAYDLVELTHQQKPWYDAYSQRKK